MTLQQLIATNQFHVLNQGNNLECIISTPFCCDLLSVAMSNAPQRCVWVTVIGNINTLAVATLVDAACIILAHNITLDSIALSKAQKEHITILQTSTPVFEAALTVYNWLHDETFL